MGPTRGREDIAVYCDDKARMIRNLSRDVSQRSAIEQTPPLRTQERALAVGTGVTTLR